MKEVTMRDAFLNELYSIAKEDRRVILISADFGAPSLDKFRGDLSGQFINVGIAEQSMISIAAGLALEGKIVFTYAILPFVTLRCLEQIKVDLCCMNLPVTLVGVGAGYAYDDSGPTHHGLEDLAAMRALPNMTILNASDSVMAGAFAQIAFRGLGPKYVRLDRAKIPPIHGKEDDFSNGFTRLSYGSDLTIIATGYMVPRAIEVKYELGRHQIDTGVIDLYRIKPFNQDTISELVKQKPRRVVTLEEGFIEGGIGSIISEALTDSGESFRLKRIGSHNQYCFQYGGRNEIHKLNGLDIESITNTIVEWYTKR